MLPLVQGPRVAAPCWQAGVHLHLHRPLRAAEQPTKPLDMHADVSKGDQGMLPSRTRCEKAHSLCHATTPETQQSSHKGLKSGRLSGEVQQIPQLRNTTNIQIYPGIERML